MARARWSWKSVTGERRRTEEELGEQSPQPPSCAAKSTAVRTRLFASEGAQESSLEDILSHRATPPNR